MKSVLPRASAALFVAALSVLGWSSATGQERTATCNTFNATNEPSSSFRGGEPIVVRGNGFIPRSAVLLSVQQGGRSLELGKVTANDLGAFELSGAVVPATVTTGKGAIRALDARNDATCSLTLRAGTNLKDDDALKPVLIAWGVVLAIFAVVLAVLTYRRWKTDRLQEAFDRLSKDRELVAGEPQYVDPADAFARTAFVEADDDEAFSHEDFMAALRPDAEPPPPARPRGPEITWEGPEPQRSDAIEQLRREVKDWKR